MKKLVLETTSPFQGLPELVAYDEGLFEKEGLLIEWAERDEAGVKQADALVDSPKGVDPFGSHGKLLEAGKAELDQLTQRLVSAGLASWSGGETEQRQLIVRGQAHLLDDLRALEDLERVRLLFDDLEEKRAVADMLGRAELAEGMRIFIGSENKLFSLSGSSTIVSPYRDGQGRIVGVLGVIGPTRLNYARIIPMVDYTARVVSRLLAP
jgi:transcriptional regulator of heat shock response